MRRLATLLLATLLTPALAQQPPAPSPNLAGIAHVALRVHSLPASIAFYEKLGFIKAFDLSRDGKVYEAFIKINDRQFIELYPADEKNPQIGFLHLCFEGADLPSVHDFYVAQGLTPNAVRTAGAGNLLFTMPGPATPQGPQNLEYTQYMPGSLHSKDFGQHLGPTRIATALTMVTIASDDPTAATDFYLTKLRFKHHAKGRLALPGPQAHGSISVVPSDKLQFKAAIAFDLGDTTPSQAASILKSHDIPFTKDPLGDPLLLDPDSNEITLRSPHVF